MWYFTIKVPVFRRLKTRLKENFKATPKLTVEWGVIQLIHIITVALVSGEAPGVMPGGIVVTTRRALKRILMAFAGRG